jgi:hypothetical protein
MLVGVHGRIQILLGLLYVALETFLRNKILSRVLVTNNAGSGLDERDYLPLIHTTSNYT